MVAVAKYPKDVAGSKTIDAAEAWLETVKLGLLDDNRDTVLIVDHRKNNTTKIRIGNSEVVLKSMIRYLS